MTRCLLAVVTALVAGCAAFPSISEIHAKAQDWELCYYSVAGETAYWRQQASYEVARKGIDCRSHMQMVQARISARSASDQKAMQMITLGSQMMNPTPVPANPATTSGPKGFLKREFISGMNKVCVYNQAGSDYVLTVQAAQLCPLTTP